MLITKQNVFNGTKATLDLDVTAAQIKRWQDGELIQDAMPNLSADEREFLMTGVLPGQWDDMF